MMVRNERLDAFYPQTPACFHQAIGRAIERIPEPSARRRRVRTALAIAALVALLGGAALAAAKHWGVLDFLNGDAQRTAQEAQDLIQSGLADPVTVDDVTFELTDAAYDGRQLYASLRMSSAERAVVPFFGFADENRPDAPWIGAGVSKVFINGEQAGIWHEDGRSDESGAYGYFSADYLTESTGALDVKIVVGTYMAGVGGPVSVGEMHFQLAVQAEGASDKTIPGDADMNGCSLVNFEFKQTPFKLYLSIAYTIDPALDRFEKLRREYMMVELYDEQGEPIRAVGGGGYREPDNGVYSTNSEWSADGAPHKSLTIKLRGMDEEVYGTYTFDCEEVTK